MSDLKAVAEELRQDAKFRESAILRDKLTGWADRLDAAAKEQAANDKDRDDIDKAHGSVIHSIAKTLGLDVYGLDEVVEKAVEQAAEIERLKLQLPPADAAAIDAMPNQELPMPDDLKAVAEELRKEARCALKDQRYGDAGHFDNLADCLDAAAKEQAETFELGRQYARASGLLQNEVNALKRTTGEQAAEIERLRDKQLLLREGIRDIGNAANGAMQYSTGNMMQARWQLVVKECERLLALKGGSQ